MPYGADQTAYLVIDPLADRPPFAAKPKSRGPTIIVDLMSGQFNGPTRVVAFNRLESIDRRTSKNMNILCSKFRPAAIWREPAGFEDGKRN